MHDLSVSVTGLQTHHMPEQKPPLLVNHHIEDNIDYLAHALINRLLRLKVLKSTWWRRKVIEHWRVFVKQLRYKIKRNTQNIFNISEYERKSEINNANASTIFETIINKNYRTDDAWNVKKLWIYQSYGLTHQNQWSKMKVVNSLNKKCLDVSR